MQPLAVKDWDASLQHIIDDMQGRPLNIHRLMANHPDFLNAWWSFRMYSIRGGDLSQRECELVILRVAVQTGTWYEWAAHVDRGLAAGLSRDEIDRVAGSPGERAWSQGDSLLLTAVDQLLINYRILPKTLNELGKYFSERQIMDVVSLQGLYVALAGMIATWGTDIEEELAERLPADVSEQSFRQLLSATHGN